LVLLSCDDSGLTDSRSLFSFFQSVPLPLLLLEIDVEGDGAGVYFFMMFLVVLLLLLLLMLLMLLLLLLLLLLLDHDVNDLLLVVFVADDVEEDEDVFPNISFAMPRCPPPLTLLLIAPRLFGVWHILQRSALRGLLKVHVTQLHSAEGDDIVGLSAVSPNCSEVVARQVELDRPVGEALLLNPLPQRTRTKLIFDVDFRERFFGLMELLEPVALCAVIGEMTCGCV